MEDRYVHRKLDEIQAEQQLLIQLLKHALTTMQFPREKPEDMVGWEYINQRTGLSERTIKNRTGGLREVPLARRKPMAWFRGHVDLWLKREFESAQTAKQKAYRLLNRRPRLPRYPDLRKSKS
jgi:hypothetical protein